MSGCAPARRRSSPPRALIDKRGRRDAAVDEVARAARMRLIYRSFDSKEEIFVLTVFDYLAELEARGAELPDTADPVVALRGVAETFDPDPERVREACVQDALALARITDGAPA